MTESEHQAKSLKSVLLIVIGDIEAALSLFTFVYALTMEVKLWNPKAGLTESIVVLSIGFGLSLGGIRFGDIVGKWVAWFSATIHALVIIGLIYGNRVPWKVIKAFWSPILF